MSQRWREVVRGEKCRVEMGFWNEEKIILWTFV